MVPTPKNIGPLDERAQRVRIIISRLREGPQEWAFSLPPDSNLCVSVDDFFQALGNIYDEPDQVALAEANLTSLFQGDQEVEIYCTQFRRWSLATRWNDPALRNQFQRGLSPALKDELVHYTLPQSLEELMALMVRIDRRLRARRSEQAAAQVSVFSRVTPAVPSLPAAEPMEVGAMQTTTEPSPCRPRHALGTCFYCGDPRHWIKDCPRRPCTPQESSRNTPPRPVGGQEIIFSLVKNMEQVTYSQLYFQKSPRHSPKMHSDAHAVVYAVVRTDESQSHLPREDPVQEVQKTNVRLFSGKIVNRVLIVIIVLLCCLLGYMVYLRELSNCDKILWCDSMKQFCLNSNSSPAGCQLCPYNWLPHGDHCYYYSIETNRTWNQSRDDCKMMGADLLVIKNQEEKGFIERTLQQRVNDTYWIGLHRDGDVWRWVDEEYYNSSLFKFKVQSPERCTLMTKSGYYQDDCNRKYGTLCLKKAARIDLS
ncbi:uncharacterized protein [Dendrobates tinctorius]|uniref:uncharacterized protein n=1 Tax=Dendrobates tinctorius TaxID=92724 RepID=UPI003CC9D400